MVVRYYCFTFICKSNFVCNFSFFRKKGWIVSQNVLLSHIFDKSRLLKNVGNAVWGMGACGNSVGLSVYEAPVETFKCILNAYLAHAWLNFVTKIQKYTSIEHRVDQLARSKKLRQFCGWREWNVWKFQPIARLNI